VRLKDQAEPCCCLGFASDSLRSERVMAKGLLVIAMHH